jgi:type VI secretion system protein ImpL
MKILGIVLLWLIALIVLAVLSCGLTLYFNWPLWVALAVFVGGIALYFLLKFLRRMIILMRSRSRLAQQPQARRADPPMSPEKLLVRKWKTAVETLRHSNLRRLGDPLYVLPWFMVVGKSGTGKTTALTRARLSSPIQKVIQQTDIEQTVNCDWWYFDRAVVIDCAGRYVDPHDADRDRREWELGLDLLGRYRAREGLDGLVLAISADRLLAPEPDGIAEEGRVVRARVNQLIQMFGKRFPIYVLVTKCDRLYGFEEWARQLPEDALDQAMGYLSDELVEGEAGFVARAFDSIGARLHKLRLALVARNAQTGPELLMFPNELDQLRAGLAMFLHACLGDNPYLERPLLRGVFFSSGQQEGGAVSSLLGNLLPPAPRHPGAIAGLFLHDFFGRILPQDRHAAKPAALANQWRRVTANLGLTAWVLAVIALGIVLSVSFVGNMQTLQLVRTGCAHAGALSGRLDQDTTALTCTNDVLMQVETNDRRWLSSWIASTAGVGELEAQLKRRFVNEYRHYILPAVDQDQQADFARVGASDARGERASLILNLARSIGLLQARERGADRAALEAMPAPQPTALYSPQQTQQMSMLAISSLVWSAPDDPYLRQRLTLERAQLDQLAYADPQMSWLAGLVPDTGAVAPVRASDFWGRSVPTTTSASGVASSEAMVPAVYTEAGKEALERLVVEIRGAVSDPTQFDTRYTAFGSWYHDQRVQAWQKFTADFMNGGQPFASEADWRGALGPVSGTQGVYFSVIARLADEFKADEDTQLPGWLLLARQFQQLHQQTTRLGATNQAVKMAGALGAVGASAIRQTLGGAPQQGSRTVSNNLTAVNALTLYFGQLNKLALDAATGSGKDYQMAADFHQFAVQPQPQPSEVQNALQPLTQLRGLIGSGDPSDALTWRLIAGPFNFVLSYIEQQASCELQKNWQSSVLFPLQGATDKTAMMDQLYGAKGTVWAFADGPAKPFLVRNASNYAVVQTQGYSVPFTTAFLPMLNSALGRQVSLQVAQQRTEADKQAQAAQAQQAQLEAQQAQLASQQTLEQLDKTLATAKLQADAAHAEAVPLTITAQPTGINDGAKAKPFATILKIQCAAGIQTLNNYNFPVSVNFAWTAGQCGDTSLQIKIGNLTLERKYPGPLGVAAFLRDFRSGVHAFVPADFPADQVALNGLGVEQISVRYNFDGVDTVLNAASQIETYETLQTTTAQQKQQIQDEQAQRQQQAISQQLAAAATSTGIAGQPPLPMSTTLGIPPLPVSATSVSAPNLGALALPPDVGACWRRPVALGVQDGGGV